VWLERRAIDARDRFGELLALRRVRVHVVNCKDGSLCFAEMWAILRGICGNNPADELTLHRTSSEIGRYAGKMSQTSVQLAVGLFGVGFGLFWLYKAFATGRALGRFGFADRATQPVLFWLHVVALLLIVAVSSQQVIMPVLKERRGFGARHPVVADHDLPVSPVAPLSAKGCEESGPRVCFVIAGVAPDVPVDRLAEYASTLGSRVGILDPIALTRQVEGLPLVNDQRLQVGTGALERLVGATYPRLWGNRDVTLVILTGHDLWIENSPGQRYAFGAATSWRGGGGVAVVSSARMDPSAYRQPADPAVLERRMHVLVGKYIALLRYGATPSTDPTSPVYGAVQAPADLDRMRVLSPSDRARSWS
jgi:hypothetical protein